MWLRYNWKKVAIIGGAAAAALVLVFTLAVPAVVERQAEFYWTEKQGSNVSLAGLKVVIDAGHGGSDNGTVGVSTGRVEKEVNLEIARRLQAMLEQEGMTVVMTRQTDDAIAPTKDEDMQRRQDIIIEEQPDMFLSIHQNFFEGSEEAYGPQVFYYAEGTEGKKLALALQDAMNEWLEIADPRIALAAKYTVLGPGTQPSCTVECGFFSNPEEEKKLQNAQYQDRVAAAITEGLKRYVAEYLA